MHTTKHRGLAARILAPVAAFAIGMTICSADAAVITIDDFSDAGPGWPIQVSSPGFAQNSEFGLSGVLGGVRNTTVTLHSQVTPGLDFVNANIATGPGLLDFDSTSGSIGSLSLSYDGGGAGLGSFSGLAGVEIDFALFDLSNGAPLPVTVTLFDGSVTSTHTQSLTVAGAQSLFFAFSDFSDIGDLDLGAIQSIQFDFDGGLAADFRLSNIAVIPVPGVLALLGVGGLIGKRRRRA